MSDRPDRPDAGTTLKLLVNAFGSEWESLPQRRKDDVIELGHRQRTLLEEALVYGKPDPQAQASVNAQAAQVFSAAAARGHRRWLSFVTALGSYLGKLAISASTEAITALIESASDSD